MNIGAEKDDRDAVILAMNRLSHRDLGRFVLITETKKKDHFGTVYSEELDDAIDLLQKSVDQIEDTIAFRREGKPSLGMSPE